MKGKRWLVLVLVVIALAAVAFAWLASDPGVVRIDFRGWTIKTTVIGAIAILIAAWVAIGILWWLLRWPFGAVSQRHRRISHERLRDGLVALVEGRNVEAARTLHRAAQYATLRSPALLAAADAAHRHGDTPRALETLDEAAQHTPDAARVLRAQILRESGRPEEAVLLLAPGAEAGKLPPAGWHEYALAALASGRADKARIALEPLHKSDMLGQAGYTGLVEHVLGASLCGAADAATLQHLWKQMTRQQRQRPPLLAAYAQRASVLGVQHDALDAIEAALKREWSGLLVTAYADATPSNEAAQRLRIATRWLNAHPQDDGLLRTLGVLSVRASAPHDARMYLVRALATNPSVANWAALGDVQLATGEPTDAARCYANAWKCKRGEKVSLGSIEAGIDTSQFLVEERDDHGLPRLPGGDRPTASETGT